MATGCILGERLVEDYKSVSRDPHEDAPEGTTRVIGRTRNDMARIMWAFSGTNFTDLGWL